MNRKEINEVFCTELGQQLNELYTTSDDRVFIRLTEAISHTEGKLDENTQPLSDTTIKMWQDGDDGYFVYENDIWKGYVHEE